MSDAPPIEPIRSTVAGVELVTIPVSHYAELLECQRAARSGGFQTVRSRVHPALAALDPRSRLFGDAEVTMFLFEAFGRTKLKDAAEACRQRFGAERCPSRATIARYWARLRLV